MTQRTYRAAATRRLTTPCLTLAAVGLLATMGHAQERDRVPAPDDLALAREAVLETFPRCAQKLTGEAAIELAVLLLDTAEETDNQPTIRYALMEYALSLSGDAGDLDMVLRVIDELEGLYSIDSLATSVDSLESATGRTWDAAVRWRGAQHLARVAEDAGEAGRYDLEEQAFAAAIKAARRLKNGHLRKALEAVQAALGQLRTSPDDGEAHHALGAYLCVFGDAWLRGIDHLAQSADDQIATVAVEDAANPLDADAIMNAADNWWQLAKVSRYNAAERRAWEGRAVYWYERALPDLAGFNLRTAMRRIKEAGQKNGASSQEVRSQAEPTIPFGTELLTNPGCEQVSQQAITDIPGWFTNAGQWFRRDSSVNKGDPSPLNGGTYFFAPHGHTKYAALIQDVDVSTYARLIDSAGVDVSFTGHIGSLRQSPGDQGRITLEFLTSAEDSVGPNLVSEDIYSAAKWHKVHWREIIPKRTRILRVWLESMRQGRGAKYNNAYFDELSLRVVRAE